MSKIGFRSGLYETEMRLLISLLDEQGFREVSGVGPNDHIETGQFCRRRMGMRTRWRGLLWEVRWCESEEHPFKGPPTPL